MFEIVEDQDELKTLSNISIRALAPAGYTLDLSQAC